MGDCCQSAAAAISLDKTHYSSDPSFCCYAASFPIGAEPLIFREVEDRDLIAGARRGDVNAFNLLISRWEKRIYNYIYKLVGDREDALDLTQDVFLKAHQNLKKLEDPARFAPWLFRIAHNEAYSLLRRNRPETELTEPVYGTPGPRLMPVEVGVAVQTAMSRLSADQREAVVLKIYQGFKFEEMAEILSCPVSTVKSRVYAALEVLKDQLAPVNLRGVE
jgi:RNA polymerase sigma-70 factor (ECF subfamily)